MAVLLMFVALPKTIAANPSWLTINPLRVSLLLKLDAARNTTRHESENLKYSQYIYSSTLDISQNGYILHPAILSFSYFLQPSYSNGEHEETEFNSALTEDSLAYNVSIGILQGSVQPVSGLITASSSSTINTGVLGQRSDSDSTRFLARVAWYFQPFPVTFQYEKNTLYQVNTPGFDRPQTLRHEQENILKVEARSSKMRLDLSRFSLDDKVPDRDRDYVLDRADLRHSFEWGKGSSLISRFYYRNRTGYNENKRSGIIEKFNIKHKENLTSTVSYSHISTAQLQKSTTDEYSFGLQHRLYQNLSTYASLKRANASSETYTNTTQSINLGGSYNKIFIKSIGVGLSANGGFINNNDNSRSGYYEVVDESHKVPLTGEIILVNRFINTGTIIVSDTTGKLEYINGIDYEINQAPDNLTRLYVIPGGQISAGDIIHVSYSAETPPSMKYNQLTSSLGLFINYGSFSFSYWQSETDNTLISGESDNFLVDMQDRQATLSYTRNTPKTSLQLSTSQRRVKNGSYKANHSSFNQSFDMSISHTARINLTLTEDFSRSAQENTDNYLMNLTLMWLPNTYWTVKPTLGVWNRAIKRNYDSYSEYDELLVTAGLQLTWSYGLLNMNLSYTHLDRKNNGIKSLDDRLYFSLRRRF